MICLNLAQVCQQEGNICYVDNGWIRPCRSQASAVAVLISSSTYMLSRHSVPVMELLVTLRREKQTVIDLRKV